MNVSHPLLDRIWLEGNTPKFTLKTLPTSIDDYKNQLLSRMDWTSLEIDDTPLDHTTFVPPIKDNFESTGAKLRSSIERAMRSTPSTESLSKYFSGGKAENITFKIPDTNLGYLDLSMLHDPTYVKSIKKILTRLEYSSTFLSINRFHYPKHSDLLYELQIDDATFEFIGSLEAIYNHQFADASHAIKSLFSNDIPYDKFMEFLEMKVVSDVFNPSNEDMTHMNLVNQFITIQIFIQLLDLFGSTQQSLKKAKIAGFVQHWLAEKREAIRPDDLLPPHFLEYCISNRRHKYLYRIAECVTYFNELPIHLIHYNQSNQSLLKFIAEENATTSRKSFLVPNHEADENVSKPDVQLDELAEYIFSLHYLVIIHGFYPHTIPLPMLLDYLENNIVCHHSTLLHFFEIDIWKLLFHRHVNYAEMGQFLIQSLFSHSYHEDLLSAIRQVDFIAHFIHHCKKYADNIQRHAHLKKSVDILLSFIELYIPDKFNEYIKYPRHCIEICTMCSQPTKKWFVAYVTNQLVQLTHYESNVFVKCWMKKDLLNKAFSALEEHNDALELSKFMLIVLQFSLNFELLKIVEDESLLANAMDPHGDDSSVKEVAKKKRIFGIFKRSKKKDTPSTPLTPVQEEESDSLFFEFSSKSISSMINIASKEAYQDMNVNSKVSHITAVQHVVLKMVIELQKMEDLHSTLQTTFVVMYNQICSNPHNCQNILSTAFDGLYQLLKYYPKDLDCWIDNGGLTLFFRDILSNPNSHSTVIQGVLSFFIKLFNLRPLPIVKKAHSMLRENVPLILPESLSPSSRFLIYQHLHTTRHQCFFDQGFHLTKTTSHHYSRLLSHLRDQLIDCISLSPLIDSFEKYASRGNYRLIHSLRYFLHLIYEHVNLENLKTKWFDGDYKDRFDNLMFL